jgi:hypothetical protein
MQFQQPFRVSGRPQSVKHTSRTSIAAEQVQTIQPPKARFRIQGRNAPSFEATGQSLSLHTRRNGWGAAGARLSQCILSRIGRSHLRSRPYNRCGLILSRATTSRATTSPQPPPLHSEAVARFTALLPLMASSDRNAAGNRAKKWSPTSFCDPGAILGNLHTYHTHM